MRVAITGVGVVTPAGSLQDWRALCTSGGSILARAGDGRDALVPGIAESTIDVRPFLRRRKDRKLLARAAHLAIPAAAAALGSLQPEEVGLFLGVGREPPEDATEAAIVASGRSGALDPLRLGREGLALYPPLASLRTLPNLTLAHVAIQLGLRGEGGTCAGDGTAGLAAIVEGALAVEEGRCEVALAGGADSRVHPALVRDQVRRGIHQGAGEAAALFRLERPEAARAGGRPILGVIVAASTGFDRQACTPMPHWPLIGWCGAADGALALATAVGEATRGSLSMVDHASVCATIGWEVPYEGPS